LQSTFALPHVRARGSAGRRERRSGRFGLGWLGRFTVDKSVTVVAAPGVFAGIAADINQTGITITGAATDTVVLRGLTLRGPFNPLQLSVGISGGSSAAVHVENCSISGFAIGIGFAGTGSTQLFVKDTTIKNCNSGIQTATARVTVDNCRIEGNGTGWLVGVATKATIRRSVVAANGQGLTAGGAGTDLNIDDCTVSNNSDGIRSDSLGSTVRVANTTVTGNTNGLLSFGGALLSRTPATNTVEGNSTNGTFTGLYTAK
jgi:Right handed beta helix region